MDVTAAVFRMMAAANRMRRREAACVFARAERLSAAIAGAGGVSVGLAEARRILVEDAG